MHKGKAIRNEVSGVPKAMLLSTFGTQNRIVVPFAQKGRISLLAPEGKTIPLSELSLLAQEKSLLF